ncbi:hypothetical protein [Embleya sp. AB8]|uniref:hypothetical protein n=1 Tax=Embleya sp. AB8 TaxID=3156304 RepID=UPI003C719DFC
MTQWPNSKSAASPIHAMSSPAADVMAQHVGPLLHGRDHMVSAHGQEWMRADVPTAFLVDIGRELPATR